MHLDHLLLALLILLVISATAVALSRRLGLGSILGLLIAGVLIGPTGIDLVQRVDEIREVSELGIVFLLFLIGLEMHPQRLWTMRRLVFGLGSAQVVVTGLALALYVLFIGSAWNVALLLGLGLALSSTAFVLPMLEERGQMAAPHGRAAFGILLLQDLAIVPLLALVPLLADQESVERKWHAAVEDCDGRGGAGRGLCARALDRARGAATLSSSAATPRPSP